MPTCKKCEKEFPNWKYIDGQNRNISKRKYCLECSPFGSKNRISLDKKGGQCIVCRKDLVNNQTKFCSVKCKNKYYIDIAPIPYSKRSEVSKKASQMATKRLMKRLRKKRDEIWGTRCYICQYNHRLCLHNKNGIVHSSYYLHKALKQPDEWVRLCSKCHAGVHFCMTVFGWEWKEIEGFIRKNIPIIW